MLIVLKRSNVYFSIFIEIFLRKRFTKQKKVGKISLSKAQTFALSVLILKEELGASLVFSWLFSIPSPKKERSNENIIQTIF
ncbi:TPA: hypothetical protein TUD22_000210 [Streptococcus equi subsp. zooepidemicus]|uniref:hypothetical protein n=1 Tax=Streptococcus equi TaxID=1336 RepID=UPI001E5800EF|nr:hypothetical protein [Streptococcus equi]MCD3461289.1 hypothetical protein [Streptococcus equi subsp. zooepidemicus]HEK9980533.1 hypothetical protein [Streptococcus equi subsp. zooepidemicus]HEL0019884.1 hypothetical protein [Streptococcus equi subsp. zooepidemicus]HEL0028780.1 hypothetical protein [Streptococcus equi subsp. zooepidemicus]HEL0143950.1 hypothetical protein [Streptococcus equi subsp. zooepidemicus]